jgi:biotin carboxyl carrier protein
LEESREGWKMKTLARVGNKSYKMKIEPAAGGTYRVLIDDDEYLVDARRVGGGAILSLLVEGRSYEIHVAGAKGDYHVALVGSAFDVALQDELASRVASDRPGDAAGVQSINAPMPGLIVEIKVAEGDRVEKGQAVAIVEAMKMQNELSAPGPGKVSEVHVKKGDAVASGQPLITLASE